MINARVAVIVLILVSIGIFDHAIRRPAVVKMIPTPPSHPPQRRGHILVIVLSETRAYKHTYDRFKQHVLDRLDADLALCVADRVVNLVDNPFYVRANYTWVFPDLEDWGDAFDIVYRTKYLRTGAKWRDILSVGDQFMGGIKNQPHKGSAGILLFMRWWLRQRLAEMTVQYDWYVVTRSDYYYLHPHPTYIFNSTDTIWIPEGEDWGGVTDRHAVLPNNLVNTWLDFVDTLMTDPQAMIAAMRRVRPRDGWNLEAVLKWRLEANGVYNRVRRFKQGMFTVRDSKTRTRWSTGKWDPALKLYVKYPEEYKRAKSFSL